MGFKAAISARVRRMMKDGVEFPNLTGLGSLLKVKPIDKRPAFLTSMG